MLVSRCAFVMVLIANSVVIANPMERSVENPIENPTDKCAQSGFLPQPSVSFDQLRAWLESIKVNDSVELYSALTKQFPEFSENVMSLAHSRSAQGPATTPEHPRLITYHSMGVVMGLVDPEASYMAEHKKKIEGIRYNFRLEQWQPFHGEITPSGVKLFESKADTLRCFSCHGETFTPIWRTYRVWVGQSENFPRSEVNRFREYGWTSGETGQFLTMFLNRLNYRRILAELKKNKNWAKLRAATVAALLDCPDMESFISPQFSNQLSSRELSSWRAEIEKTVRDNYEVDQKYAATIGDEIALRSFRNDSEFEDVGRLATLSYLFEPETQVSRFSMSKGRGFQSRGYGFNEIGSYMGGVMNLLCQVLPDYLAEGGKSREILNWLPYSDYRVDRAKACAELKIESIEVTGLKPIRPKN